jgi:DNA-binding response OmpR family regulator
MENSQKKVLVVEDDEAMRNILVDRLIMSNYQIFQAVDGEHALSLILEKKPDIILLDLLLPKLDGFQVLERLRHYPDPAIAETKVIVLSNLWSNKDILRAQALKIDEYFVKANTNLDEVFSKVKAIAKSMGN